MSGMSQFAKYINAPIAAKYGVSGPKYFSPSLHGLSSSFMIQNLHQLLIVFFNGTKVKTVAANVLKTQ